LGSSASNIDQVKLIIFNNDHRAFMMNKLKSTSKILFV